VAVVIIPANAPLPYNPNYSKNYERAKDHLNPPCCICGKTVKNQRLVLAVDAERSEMLSAEEAAYRAANGLSGEKCSYYPVGSECARLPGVRPYVQKGA
jgi:hypothetical protein